MVSCLYFEPSIQSISLSVGVVISDWFSFKVILECNLMVVLLLQVIDLLIFKGMEELTDIVDHAKQRHHIIGQYVVGEGLVQNTGNKDQGKTDFLKNFYTSNYF